MSILLAVLVGSLISVGCLISGGLVAVKFLPYLQNHVPAPNSHGTTNAPQNSNDAPQYDADDATPQTSQTPQTPQTPPPSTQQPVTKGTTEEIIAKQQNPFFSQPPSMTLEMASSATRIHQASAFSAPPSQTLDVPWGGSRVHQNTASARQTSGYPCFQMPHPEQNGRLNIHPHPDPHNAFFGEDSASVRIEQDQFIASKMAD